MSRWPKPSFCKQGTHQPMHTAQHCPPQPHLLCLQALSERLFNRIASPGHTSPLTISCAFRGPLEKQACAMGHRGLIVGKSHARLFPYYLLRDHQPRVRKDVAMNGVKVANIQNNARKTTPQWNGRLN